MKTKNNILQTPFVQNTVKFIKKNKDIFVILLVLFVILPAIGGGKTNLDSAGKLLKSRAITQNSTWSLSNGLMDFLFVIPIGKGIIYFSNIFNSPIIALGIVAIIVQFFLWIINRKSNIDGYKNLYIQKELEKEHKEENKKLQELIRSYGKKTKKELNEIELKEYKKLELQIEEKIETRKKELYKKNNIKEHSMMFSSAFQLIVLMGIYYAAQRTQVIYDYSFFDINLSVKLANGMQASYQYIILLILMVAVQFISQNLSDMLNTISNKEKKSQTKADILTKKIMRIINCLMIGFIALIGMQFPTVLTVYWIMSSLISMIKTIIERKLVKRIEIAY